ncbi:MAG TPA: DUF4382 domain-containing protein [Nitrososphaerales archaeon]|nr:DUF4382 domain-containing protein [Nitrososphaerales archaeon]
MKLGTKVAAYGLAGLVLAGMIIFSGSSLGLLNFGSSGVLSVLLTDPPSVPEGVSAVYVTYSNIAVHVDNSGDSGWVTIAGAGTIDTLKLVNLSQTISSATIPSLSYNLVAFDISSVKVDFMGTNYSATVNSPRLIVPIVGGVKVNSAHAAAALVDIQPTVLNLGDRSSPRFAVSAGARALQVPESEETPSMNEVGIKSSLEGRSWLQSFRASHSDALTSSGLTLTHNSFSFSVTNPGSESLTIRLVVVTPASSGERLTAALGSLANSFVFAVGSDGSLKLQAGASAQVQSVLEASGYSLAQGATHQFTYLGAITSLLGSNGISSGTSYNVITFGSEALSVQTVVAS